MRALIVEYFGGTPRAKNGTRPQRIVTPSRSRASPSRTTGTCWVGATFQLGVNCHSGRITANSRSTSSWPGVT
jgi:hypothetical protein